MKAAELASYLNRFNKRAAAAGLNATERAVILSIVSNPGQKTAAIASSQDLPYARVRKVCTAMFSRDILGKHELSHKGRQPFAVYYHLTDYGKTLASELLGMQVD